MRWSKVVVGDGDVLYNDRMSTVFSTQDIRGKFGDTLTSEYVWNVGKAFAEWVPEEGMIVVARSETASQAAVHALIEGLLLQGRNVIDAGVGDWQLVVNTMSDRTAVGGVMVSHDDLQGDEVIALFAAQGVAVTTDNGLAEIGQLVEAPNFDPAAQKGTVIV